MAQNNENGQGCQQEFDYGEQPPEAGGYGNDGQPEPQRGGQMARTDQRQMAQQGQRGGAMTRKQWEDAIRECLNSELTEHAKALPEGFRKERFMINALTVVSDHAKDLGSIHPASIGLCLAKGAYLGLDFLNGECYAIPYSGVANFQTDYKGEIKLAKKYSRRKIKEIYAKLVRSGDFFEESVSDGHQSVNFKPVPFSDAEIIGAFAVVLFEDGGMIYDTMSAKEIEHTRKAYSKAANSKAWKESAGEMYKKTVLRRLLKLVDLDFDSREQVQAFQEGSNMEFEGQGQGRIIQTVMDDSVQDVFAAQPGA